MDAPELQPRLLGIDYGDARIGLAVSDELGFLAHPLETIHCRKTHPLKRIAEVVAKKQISKIILGKINLPHASLMIFAVAPLRKQPRNDHGHRFPNPVGHH